MPIRYLVIPEQTIIDKVPAAAIESVQPGYGSEIEHIMMEGLNINNGMLPLFFFKVLSHRFLVNVYVLGQGLMICSTFFTIESTL